MNSKSYFLFKTADDNNNGVGTGTIAGGALALGGLGSMGYGHNLINKATPDTPLFSKGNQLGTLGYGAANIQQTKTIGEANTKKINDFVEFNGGKEKFDVNNLDETGKKTYNKMLTEGENIANLGKGSKFMHYGKIGGLLGGGMMLGSMLTNNN